MSYKHILLACLGILVLLVGAIPVQANTQPNNPETPEALAKDHQIFLPMVSSNWPIVPTLDPIDNSDGDGEYTFYWNMPDIDTTIGYYETEFSFNDPTFANGEIAQIDSWYKYQSGIYTWPGTHYWRVRAFIWDGDDYSPTAWSNVQYTTVGNFAYLYVDNDSYAFNMTVQISGNGIQDSIRLAERDYAYWRSVPVGSYKFTITNLLCYPDTRSQTISLGNTIANGAYYLIDTCEPIYGPMLWP